MTEKKPVFYYGAEASVLGVVKAVLYNQVRYFTTACPDPKHFYENSYWVRFSMDSLSTFTGIPQKTIYDNLIKLEKEGYIKTGNFNKLKFDRTKWYSLTDKPIQVVEENKTTTDIPYLNNRLPIHDIRTENSESQNSQDRISDHNTYNNLNNNKNNNSSIINKNNNTTNSGDFLTHQYSEQEFFEDYLKRKGLV